MTLKLVTISDTSIDFEIKWHLQFDFDITRQAKKKKSNENFAVMGPLKEHWHHI